MAQDPTLEEDVFTGRLDLALWRKVVVFARPYRKYLVRLVMVAAIVAFFDISFPLIVGSIIDALYRHSQTGADPHLGLRLAAYIALIVSFAACIWGFIIICGKITVGVSHDIRKAAFEKLQELPFSFYDRKAVGWLMARLTSDVGNLSRVLGWAMLDLVWGTSVLTAVAAVMFCLTGRLHWSCCSFCRHWRS